MFILQSFLILNEIMITTWLALYSLVLHYVTYSFIYLKIFFTKKGILLAKHTQLGTHILAHFVVKKIENIAAIC